VNARIRALAIELERLAEQCESNPDKASLLMEAVGALREDRIDLRLAIEVALYAQIEEDAGHEIESSTLDHAAVVLRAPQPSLPLLPPARRHQSRRR
jgi:hypothetical protein